MRRVLENSRVLKELAAQNERFAEYLRAPQLVDQVHRIVNDKTLLGRFLAAKEKMWEELLPKADRDEVARCVVGAYRDRALQQDEVSSEREGDQLSIGRAPRSEVEPQPFAYQRQLDVIRRLNFAVEDDLVRDLLRVFRGDIGFVLDEIYKLE